MQSIRENINWRVETYNWFMDAKSNLINSVSKIRVRDCAGNEGYVRPMPQSAINDLNVLDWELSGLTAELDLLKLGIIPVRT